MKLNFKNNLLIKIVSILIAITLWFIVIGKNNTINEKTFNISRSQIQVINQAVDDSLLYKIMENEIIISVKGTAEVLDQLTVSSLNPTIDVDRLKVGKYNLPLSFSLPANVKTDKAYKVEVSVTKA